MRNVRIAIAALSTFVLLAAGLTFAAQTKGGKDKVLERGKYLTTILGCNDCHTPGTFYGAPDMKRFLSGTEMGWEGPWGVVYAANLTPDEETGLGEWNEADVVRAIRTGNRPDGRQLAPIMPWMNFAAMTDEDAMAVARYLRSLPAVKHRVPAPVAPGAEVTGPVLRFPPPSAWDAPREGQGGEGH